MKILFIAPYIPNQIRVRPYQWIRSLVQRGHELTLLAAWSSPEEEGDIQALRESGVRVVAHRLPRWRSLANAAGALFSELPLQAVYCMHPELMRKLEHVVQEDKLDVVHVEHLRGARYGLHARHENGGGHIQRNHSLPIVWDSVDCISHLFRQASQHSRSWQGRMLTRLDLPRTRRYEGWLVQQFDRILVTSPTDKAALIDLARRWAPQSPIQESDALCHQLDEKVSVLANGVDLAYFTPSSGCSESARIVFTGKMSYHANITAVLHLVQEIMPLVWTHRPDAELWIVGKDPVAEIRALATEKGVASNAQTPRRGRIVVTGSVADLRPFLQQATVAVAPIVYGAGIQNKVLEAMACGAPVVASQQAASALAVENGRELLIASNATDFGQAIVALLDDPQQRLALSQQGRSYVEQKHSWEDASAHLERVYEGAIAAHQEKL